MSEQKHDYPDAAPAFNVRESTDIDHYRAQPGKWSVEVTQLAKGDFGSRIRTVEFPGLIAYDNQWNCPVLIHGQSPDGWLMFGGMVDPDRATVTWCGNRLDRQNFAATGDSREIEFSVENRASNAVVLIEPGMLARAVGEESVEVVRRAKKLDVGTAGSRFVGIVKNMLSRFEAQPDLLDRPAIASRAVSALMSGVEDCFAELYPGRTEQQKRSRGEVVHEAILHVHSSGKPISAWEMAQAVGVSQKTLELAFRAVMNTTPGKYLALTRLNSAHHALAHASKMETTVTNVAMNLGFTHMGRFSSAYSELFGELPSDTLSQTPSHTLRV